MALAYLIRLLLFVWLVLLAALTYAAPEFHPRIQFQNIIQNKDIALGEVLVIYQDQAGFMWFGGGSKLVRFDGYGFQEIPLLVSENGKTKYTPMKFASDIYEDAQGRIWVTSRDGFFEYRPERGGLVQRAETNVVMQSFDRNIDTSVPGFPVSSLSLSQAVQYNEHEFLLASARGLIVANVKHNTYIGYQASQQGKNALKGFSVYAIYKIDDHRFYVGTDAGLEIVDWQQKTFTFIDIAKDLPDNALARKVNSLDMDKDGILWIGTSAGLVRYDPTNGAQRRFRSQPMNAKAIQDEDIWKVKVDHQNVLWLATNGGGVSVYDNQNDRFYSYTQTLVTKGSLSTDVARTVFEDNTGDIWVGTYPDGVNFFDRSTTAIKQWQHDSSDPHSISNHSVTSILESENGNLWLGTDGGGLNYFDRTSGEFTVYKYNGESPNSISSNAVLSVTPGSENHIWVGTWGGAFFKFDTDKRIATRYPFDSSPPKKSTYESDELKSISVWHVREDGDSNIWISSHFAGYVRFREDDQVFLHNSTDYGTEQAVDTNLIWTSMVDSLGTTWLGSASTLIKFDPNTNKATNFRADLKNPTTLSNGSVLSLFEDSKDRFWVGTEAGLNLMDRKNGTFQRFGKEHGLNDVTIRSIVEDEQGKLWLPSNNGISVLDPTDNSVEVHDRINGKLIGGFHTNSGILSSKGEIILGGHNGLFIFDPRKMTPNLTPPKMVLTDLQIFTERIKPGDPKNILNTVIHKVDKIVLDHTQSVFTLHFSGLSYRDTEKNEYAYQLEGFDKDWQHVGTERRAKYTNLDPGTYIFKVKGSNSDNIWSDTPATITIVQLPPPWRTWWAYCLYALSLTVFLLWIFNTARRKQLETERTNRELERKVSERTFELNEKTNDIQAMLSHLPQGLFTITKTGLIHHEYSKYLEKIFELQDLTHRKASDVLFKHSNITGDKLHVINAALSAILEQNQINFMFNKTHLPREYGVFLGEQEKQLELDWNPILVDGITSKLMVSVRDVTKLKTIEKEAQENDLQLKVVGQLMHIAPTKFIQFELSAKQCIELFRSSLDRPTDTEPMWSSDLLFQLHTLKGNASTLGLSHITKVVHECESLFEHYQKNGLTSNVLTDLKNIIQKLEEELDMYSNVFHKILHPDRTLTENGIWITQKNIDLIKDAVQEGSSEKLKRATALLDAMSFENIIQDIVDSTQELAYKLGKKPPRFQIEFNNIFIKFEASQLIRDVFTHLIRNALDHGLEEPKVRESRGKTAAGLICITAELCEEQLKIRVKDDGYGLNLDRLRKIHQSHNRNNGVQLSNTETAALIFKSGLSTQAKVTDISGRGVGMGAVKSLLIEHGGDIDIQLLEGSLYDERFHMFELILSLPASLCVQAEI